MPNRSPLVLLLAALLVAATGPAHAAALGRGFTYQGQLQQAGVPVDGAVSLRFSLWDAAGAGEPPTGGNLVGAMQSIANVAVTGGVFSVVLNANDEFGSQAFGGEARWLQVEVCTDSTCASTTVLGPRQPLTGAPYALGPWQMNGSVLHYDGGKVGIGTASPAYALHIKTVGPAIILEDSASPSQQAGYLAFWNGVSETGWMGYGSPGSPDMTFANARSGGDIVLWATGERMRVDSGGNVGIGTSTPVSKLEVRGDVRMGTAGEFFAPGSVEKLRIVRGTVNPSGVIIEGSGFTATRTATGRYTVTFSTAFTTNNPPTVTLAGVGSVTVTILASLYSPVTTTTMFVRTTNGAGTETDGTFHFIAMGPR